MPAWYAKKPHMWNGNVILHSVFYIDENGRLHPDPEGIEAQRCQMFPDLFRPAGPNDVLTDITPEELAEVEAALQPAEAEDPPEQTPTPSVFGTQGTMNVSSSGSAPKRGRPPKKG